MKTIKEVAERNITCTKIFRKNKHSIVQNIIIFVVIEVFRLFSMNL